MTFQILTNCQNDSKGPLFHFLSICLDYKKAYGFIFGTVFFSKSFISQNLSIFKKNIPSEKKHFQAQTSFFGTVRIFI